MNSKKALIRGTQRAISPEVLQQYGERIDRAFGAVQIWAESNLPDSISQQGITSTVDAIKGILWQQLGQRVEELERGMDVMRKYLEDTFGDRLTKEDVLNTLAQVRGSVAQTVSKRLEEPFLATEQPTVGEPATEEPVQMPIEEEPIQTAPRAVPIYNWNFPVEMEKGVAETLLDDYGFISRGNAWGNISFDYSKIKEKELRDGDIRQAIITMNPNITPAELTDLATVAQKNTAELEENKQKGKEVRGIQYLEKKAKKEDSYTLTPISIPEEATVAEEPAPEEPVVDAYGTPVYKWEFPEEMDKNVAEALLEDRGFVNWDSDVQFDYSKIMDKDLKDDSIRQAIITVHPDMAKEDLAFVAHKNTVEAEGGSMSKAKDVDNLALASSEVEPEPAEVDFGEGEPFTEETVVEPEASVSEGANSYDVVIKMKNGRALTAEEIKGAVAWQQGIMHKLIFPPYGQNDVVNSREPFQGVVSHANARNAYETLVRKHQGKLPSTIVRHMGMMTFSITGGDKKHGSPKVKVIEREDRKNTAQTISGL